MTSKPTSIEHTHIHTAFLSCKCCNFRHTAHGVRLHARVLRKSRANTGSSQQTFNLGVASRHTTHALPVYCWGWTTSLAQGCLQLMRDLYMHTPTHTHTHTHRYTHTHIYIYIHMYAHKHTHTLIHRQCQKEVLHARASLPICPTQEQHLCLCMVTCVRFHAIIVHMCVHACIAWSLLGSIRRVRQSSPTPCVYTTDSICACVHMPYCPTPDAHVCRAHLCTRSSVCTLYCTF